MKDPKIEGTVWTEGLKDNEFVAFEFLMQPQGSLRARHAAPSGVLDRDHGADVRIESERFTLGSDLNSLMGHLAERLPGQTKLEHLAGQATTWWSSIPGLTDQPPLAASTWVIEGTQCRVDHLGSFPVRERSSHRLDGGGMVRTWDLQRTRYETSLGFRLIQPDPPFVPERKLEITDGGFVNRPPAYIWGIMVDESGTRALMVLDGRNYWMEPQRAFGARWSDFWVNLRYLGNPGGWTEEEVLRSEIHLFASSPVAKVSASLPPP